ncbi:hypothetical protein [Opitutus terrae]|uniref:Uncharacterized protein n=1 Tax=Opitutus terrae (strain DSM 11246 / JCM 15787 / PB90-1) TaxID=452637 RepID=B1ZV48_OPITP|nr:hypothetical protein [Opitutus terrae]ACB76715.1 hypothetical protein Oter_3438 [Opitutus terrae PB90-1]
MAFQKTFILPNGITGHYLRIGAHRLDRRTREASFQFDLFASQAHADACPADPVRSLVAKLRLDGDKFDTWVSHTAMAQSGQTLYARAYAAAKVESVICDVPAAAGCATVFSDAIDV